MIAPRVMYRPSLANLPLQMSLYYNSLFSLLFAVVIGACSLTKNLYYNKRVSISVIIIWAFLEPIRLYYGWSGNLQERVPELSSYLLLTIFPQTPFALYLAYIQPVRYPIDPILGSFMLAFLLFQFYFALFNIRMHIRSQTAQFMRLCEEE